MGFNFGMDKLLRHCPFQNCIALFIQPAQIFFIALQSWSSRHVIQFLNLVSKHSPLQCFYPCGLKKDYMVVVFFFVIEMLHICTLQYCIVLFYTSPEIFYSDIIWWSSS